MSQIISYRHNVMSINSIDAFTGIKGGCNNNLRDVYFVRALGECNNYLQIINDMDMKLTDEMYYGRLKYLRISKLQNISNQADTVFYMNSYDSIGRVGFKLKNSIVSDQLRGIINNALTDVILKYRTYKTSVSDSMIRNYATKILFWTDTILRDVLNDWDERLHIKIVVTDVQKEQEYLFYYFLTLIGCDVLLLENKKDIEIASDLLKLSYQFKLGGYGNTAIPEYNKEKFQKQTDKQTKISENLNVVQGKTDNNQGNGRVVVTIPQRNKPSKNAKSNESIQQRTIVNTVGNPTNNSLVTEKSFEELALCASSIVMIAVHDRNGEITGTGSGIMIGKDGYILTNHHVASGGRFYSVRIEDDSKTYVTDEVIKYNSSLDLAIIRIDRILKPLPIYRGRNKLVRGQKVVAIGSPLGLFNSVSDGIISGFRVIDDVDMIQFTAPISHGSSGGAVMNMQGEVIGISTAGIDRGQNINLAVGFENIRMFAKGFYKDV